MTDKPSTPPAKSTADISIHSQTVRNLSTAINPADWSTRAQTPANLGAGLAGPIAAPTSPAQSAPANAPMTPSTAPSLPSAGKDK